MIRNGVKHSTQQSDVWSLGVVIFEILTSCQLIPYHPLQNQQVIEAVLGGEGYHILSDLLRRLTRTIHPFFLDLMKSCLNNTPILRPEFSALSKLLQVSVSMMENEVEEVPLSSTLGS